MPKILIYLVVSMVISAAIAASRAILKDKLYYDKIQYGVIQRKDILTLWILKIGNVVSYIMVGVGMIATLMYVMLLINPTPM